MNTSSSDHTLAKTNTDGPYISLLARQDADGRSILFRLSTRSVKHLSKFSTEAPTPDRRVDVIPILLQFAAQTKRSMSTSDQQTFDTLTNNFISCLNSDLQRQRSNPVAGWSRDGTLDHFNRLREVISHGLNHQVGDIRCLEEAASARDSMDVIQWLLLGEPELVEE